MSDISPSGIASADAEGEPSVIRTRSTPVTVGALPVAMSVAVAAADSTISLAIPQAAMTFSSAEVLDLLH